MAGLFDKWHTGKEGEDSVLYSYTILTTDVSGSLEWLHDRMPVILTGKGGLGWSSHGQTTWDDWVGWLMLLDVAYVCVMDGDRARGQMVEY